MTDPNDDLSSVADPGSMGTDAMTEPSDDNTGDLDEDHREEISEQQGGVPGAAVDSPATQGSPIGPPD